jgi:hypothetical protein
MDGFAPLSGVSACGGFWSDKVRHLRIPRLLLAHIRMVFAIISTVAQFLDSRLTNTHSAQSACAEHAAQLGKKLRALIAGCAGQFWQHPMTARSGAIMF